VEQCECSCGDDCGLWSVSEYTESDVARRRQKSMKPLVTYSPLRSSVTDSHQQQQQLAAAAAADDNSLGYGFNYAGQSVMGRGHPSTQGPDPPQSLGTSYSRSTSCTTQLTGLTKRTLFSIYISRLCYDVSVRLSVCDGSELAHYS